MNIKMIGGLLSAYSLGHDPRLARKALDLGQRLLSGFDHLLPKKFVHLREDNRMTDKQARAAYPKPELDPKRIVVLDQAGCLSLEFRYLSFLSGDTIFRERAEAVIEAFEGMIKANAGLFPAYIWANQTVQTEECTLRPLKK